MVGIVHDAANNISYPNVPTWRNQILDTFGEARLAQTRQYFSSSNITANFAGQSLSLSLDELCNRLLARIFSMAQSGDITDAEEIQNFGGTTILSSLLRDKNSKYTAISDGITYKFSLNIYFLTTTLSLLLSMVVLLFLLSYHQSEHKVELFREFRFMTDYEIEMLVERLHRFSRVLQLCEKNEDNEVFNALEDSTEYAQR